MIPPPGSPEPERPNAKPRPRNPWIDLGYEALGTAALLKVTDKAGLERLVNAGLTDDVTVVISDDSPLFEIEAIGNSAGQATATVREIIRRLNENVAASQKQYGVHPEDTITTLTLDDGGNVEVVTTKLKRILIVAAGVGVLLTAAGTIGLDALLRRRDRRRLGFPDPDLGPGPSGPPPPRLPDVAARPNPTASMPRRAWRDNDLGLPPSSAPPPVLSLPAAPSHDRPRLSFDEPGPPISTPRPYPEERRRPQPYIAPDDAPPPRGEHRPDGLDDEDVPADATIVLPLAYLSKRDDRKSPN
jgi:hypothetical protein